MDGKPTRNDGPDADRDQLLEALRHQRLAAEAERQAHNGRGFYISLEFVPGGSTAVHVTASTPTGDEEHELALAQTAGEAAVKALNELAFRVKGKGDDG